MSNYPLIRFVIIFVAGIIVQSVAHIQIFYLFIILVTLICFTIIMLLFKKKNYEIAGNISLLLAIVVFGSAYYSAFNQIEIKYPFEKPKLSNAHLFGQIANIELKKEGRISFSLITDSLVTKEKKYPGRYKLLCSIYDDDISIEKLFNRLSIGNKIYLEGTVQKPRDERNPGEYDYEKYLSSKGIVALVNSYKAENLKIVSNNSDYLPNLVFQIRKKIDVKINELHNKTTAGLLRGLILADRKSIDHEVKNEFVNAGVVHILSVSGLHVGYIVLIFIFTFGRFSITTRYVLTVIGLLIYMIITGADAPIFRSTVMVLITLAAPALGREYNSLNALSLSAFVILLIDPNELFNPSFQLSFSAILSLVLIYPPVNNAVNKLNLNSKSLRWLLLFLGSSLAAQIGTLPFTLTYFHRLSVTALLANFVVIPLSGMIVGLGILTIIAGSIINWIGFVFGASNELLTYFMYWFVGLMGSAKYSYIIINQFSTYDAVVFYLTLVLIFYLFKKLFNPLAKVVSISLSVILMVLFMKLDNYELTPKNVLSVIAVDVGQGDAFLLKFPNGKTALIDAGDKTQYFDNGERVILPLLDKLGIDTVDYGFISHVDSDHYKGIETLIKNQRVKVIYKPLIDSLAENDREFEKFLRQNNCSFRYYSKISIPVGNTRIYVLNDTINNYFGSVKSNDRSGLLKLVYGRTSFLFTGDAGVQIEDDYINRYGSFLHSDVLKVGHHGSKSSTSEKFVKYVSPKFAIISAGVANKFGHPNKLILDRLNESQIEVLRIDRSGAVLLQSDGNVIRSINWKKMESSFNF